MLELRDITVTGNIVSMIILIDCREDKAYKLTLDMDREVVIDTELPSDLLSYAGQTISSLRSKYKNKEIPSQMTVAWY